MRKQNNHLLHFIFIAFFAFFICFSTGIVGAKENNHPQSSQKTHAFEKWVIQYGSIESNTSFLGRHKEKIIGGGMIAGFFLACWWFAKPSAEVEHSDTTTQPASIQLISNEVKPGLPSGKKVPLDAPEQHHPKRGIRDVGKKHNHLVREIPVPPREKNTQELVCDAYCDLMSTLSNAAQCYHFSFETGETINLPKECALYSEMLKNMFEAVDEGEGLSYDIPLYISYKAVPYLIKIMHILKEGSDERRANDNSHTFVSLKEEIRKLTIPKEAIIDVMEAVDYLDFENKTVLNFLAVKFCDMHFKWKWCTCPNVRYCCATKSQICKAMKNTNKNIQDVIRKQLFLKNYSYLRQHFPDKLATGYNDGFDVSKMSLDTDKEFALSIQDYLDAGIHFPIKKGELSLNNLYLSSINGLQNIKGTERACTIYLKRNRLKIIPPRIFCGDKFSNVTLLYLSDNMLSTICHHSFVGLQNLEEIVLDNNAFTSWPDELNNSCPLLKAIYFYGSDHEQISYEKFDSFPYLTMLHINENYLKLDSFPDRKKVHIGGDYVCFVEKELQLRQNELKIDLEQAAS